MRARLAVGLAACLLSLGGAAREARAIPAFARKYTAPCALCHDQAYPPLLNDVGRRFKERGYQLEEEAERTYRETASTRPDPDQPLVVLAQVPLALRAQSRIDAAPDPGGAGANPVDLRPFEQLFLLAGASVYPGVSFMAAVFLAPSPGLHHGAVGFHDLLFGPGRLNLRVGRLLLLDFLRPEHRFITAAGDPIATTRVGLNPTVLDSTQHGIDAYGRLLGHRLFYRVAVVQGAQGPDGVRDLDGHKDLFGELQVTPVAPLRLGVLGYRGRTQITDESRGLRVRFTDRFRTLGASVELTMPAVDLFAQALHVSHDDPFGAGEHADYWGYRGEVRAPLGSRVYVIGRYDQLVSHHLGAAQFKLASVHVGALVLSNLRIAVESTVALDDPRRSRASALLDLAF